MTVRERTQERERETLAAWATRSAESRGRATPEEPCPIRTDFQRDRDRIVHSRAFRRLAHKTQVFILASQDHIRTRLTHTLEVAQIAKTLARALSLNEDLSEAIALGHDLGHTPFGHAGEWALDEAVKQRNPDDGFRHWEQSLRVVDVLERGGEGLNLTWEVRQGILGHTKGRADLEDASSPELSLEAAAVKMADRIAYVNHDLEDAIRARVISDADVPAEFTAGLGRTQSQRIGVIVSDIVEQSQGRPQLRLSAERLRLVNQLKEFLFDRVYIPTTSSEVQRVRTVIVGLFDHFRDGSDDPGRRRTACDYVAGMTDRFAVQKYMELFVPEPARFDDL